MLPSAGALQLVHHWQDAVLARLQANNATCIHSVQPSFNNEYEAKYTQVASLSWHAVAADRHRALQVS